jgi:hypothetical protein
MAKSKLRIGVEAEAQSHSKKDYGHGSRWIDTLILSISSVTTRIGFRRDKK